MKSKLLSSSLQKGGIAISLLYSLSLFVFLEWVNFSPMGKPGHAFLAYVLFLVSIIGSQYIYRQFRALERIAYDRDRIHILYDVMEGPVTFIVWLITKMGSPQRVGIFLVFLSPLYFFWTAFLGGIQFCWALFMLGWWESKEWFHCFTGYRYYQF